MSRSLRVTALLFLLYLALAILGTAWGEASVPIEDVVSVLSACVGWGDASSVPDNYRTIILSLRLPQMILLGFVGAALACSGASLQAAFENPLADPGILGITSGGALGAVLVIHLGWSQWSFLAVPIAAFVGSLAAALFVYALTYVVGNPSVYALLLTGVAVGSMTSAGVSLVMLMTREYKVTEFLAWLLGGVRNESWDHVAMVAVLIFVGCLLMLSLHRRLDAMLLGEEQALAVGVPVVPTRLLVLCLTALIAGAATAVAGSIAFVGLMVPHIVRRLTGPKSLALIPACLVGGAAFLTACDLLSRWLSQWFPVQLGILTAFLGGPAFLIVLRRRESETI